MGPPTNTFTVTVADAHSHSVAQAGVAGMDGPGVCREQGAISRWCVHGVLHDGEAAVELVHCNPALNGAAPLGKHACRTAAGGPARNLRSERAVPVSALRHAGTALSMTRGCGSAPPEAKV